VVFLREGEPLGYLPEAARTQLGWLPSATTPATKRGPGEWTAGTERKGAVLATPTSCRQHVGGGPVCR
jgi:hypothetical protein